MKIRWFAVAVMLALAGCANSPSSSSSAKPPAVNLSGFPPEFRDGYGDGCASVNAARRRDEAREHLNEAARLFDAGPGVAEDERARVRKGLEALDRAPGR